MGMLAFFPWLRARQRVTFAEFEIVPFVVGQSPGGESQGTVESVLAPYVEPNLQAVAGATLVRLADKEITADLTDEERSAAFEFAELVAFAGLSNRKFFSCSSDYCNRDDFTFFVQEFQRDSSGAKVVSRRRDGVSSARVHESVYRVPRPYHVNRRDLEVDEDLLVTLLDRRSDGDWPRYFEAIESFDRANTDSDILPERTEVIAIVGAFQRWLDCRSGNVHELADKFGEVFQPSCSPDLATCMRIPPADRERRSSVADIWIRDFYVKVRHPFAHGHHRPRPSAIWSLKEHLLLAAFLFPRLVKLSFAAGGHYDLTDRDRYEMDAFEKLAACDELFDGPNTGCPDREWPWNAIVQEAFWENL